MPPSEWAGASAKEINYGRRLEGQVRREGCEPIFYNGGFHSIRASASGSGRACLIHDLTQRKGFVISESFTTPVTSPRWNEGVLRFFLPENVKAGNLTIDMLGHLVSTDPFKNLTGVVSDGMSFADARKTGRVRQEVRNGVVVTSGSKSMSVFMVAPLTGRWNDPDTMAFPKGHVAENEPFNAANEPGFGRGSNTRIGYPVMAQYVVDSMKIWSQGRAVVMAGVGNELRNSEIHVDGDTAVTLYGPGTVVEGNTFYVYLSHSTMSPADRLPAILKLRDANGAIVRNNKFIVKSVLPLKAAAAINLLESTDVVIEGNETTGVQLLVRKDAKSNATERGNVSK